MERLFCLVVLHFVAWFFMYQSFVEEMLNEMEVC